MSLGSWHILTSQPVNFLLVNQTRSDQIQRKGRHQSRGPNSRTCILVVGQVITLITCLDCLKGQKSLGLLCLKKKKSPWKLCSEGTATKMCPLFMGKESAPSGIWYLSKIHPGRRVPTHSSRDCMGGPAKHTTFLPTRIYIYKQVGNACKHVGNKYRIYKILSAINTDNLFQSICSILSF